MRNEKHVWQSSLPPSPVKPVKPKIPSFLRHLLSITLHFLFIFPLQPNSLLADRSALDVDFGQLVERDRHRRETASALSRIILLN